MSGSSSSGGGGGSSYNPNTGMASTARGRTVKPKASKSKGASTLQIVKAADGGKLTSVDSRNTVSDTLLTGAGKALVSSDFKTDSNTYTFTDKSGGSQTTTIRDTTAFGKTATTNTVEKRKDASGNITEIKGMSPTKFAQSQQGDSSGPDTTSTSASASAPAASADEQSTASANVPMYDQSVEEKKVSAKRRVRRRGKRGLRVSKTAVGTGGAPASGLSIPKG